MASPFDRQFNTFTTRAAVSNPQQRAILDKIARALGKPSYSALDPGIQVALGMSMVFVTNSSFGQSLGLDNGASDYNNIHQGVLAAGAMPISMYQGTQYIGQGRSYGMGINTMSIASQIQEAVNQRFSNMDGTANAYKTAGLSSGTLAQLVARRLQSRGLQAGDVMSVNLSGNSAELENTLTSLTQSGKLDRSGDQAKKLFKLYAAKQAKNAAVRKALEAQDTDTLNNVYGGDADRMLADISSKDPGLADRIRSSARGYFLNDDAKKYGLSGVDIIGNLSDNDWNMVGQQERGSLQMTVATDKLKNSVTDISRLQLENIKQLSEIFGTEDIGQLDQYCQQAGIAAASSEKKIKEVADSLKKIKARAAIQGRDIKDVIGEQGDMVSIIGQVLGGAANVNSYYKDSAAGQSAVQEQRRRRGLTALSPEQIAANRTEVAANDLMNFNGVAELEYIIGDNPFLKKQYGDQVSALKAAFESGDVAAMQEASQQAAMLAIKLNGGALTEQQKVEASKKHGAWYSQQAEKGNAFGNVAFMTSQLIGSGVLDNVFEGSGAMTEDGVMSFMNSAITMFGADEGAMKDFFNQERIAEFNALDAAGQQAEIDNHLKRLKAGGATEEQLAAVRQMYVFRGSLRKDQTDMLQFAAGKAMTAPGVNAMESLDAKAAAAYEEQMGDLKNLVDNVDTEDLGGAGSAFIKGLLGNDSLTDSQVIAYAIAQDSSLDRLVRGENQRSFDNNMHSLNFKYGENGLLSNGADMFDKFHKQDWFRNMFGLDGLSYDAAKAKLAGMSKDDIDLALSKQMGADKENGDGAWAYDPKTKSFIRANKAALEKYSNMYTTSKGDFAKTGGETLLGMEGVSDIIRDDNGTIIGVSTAKGDISLGAYNVNNTIGNKESANALFGLMGGNYKALDELSRQTDKDGNKTTLAQHAELAKKRALSEAIVKMYSGDDSLMGDEDTTKKMGWEFDKAMVIAGLTKDKDDYDTEDMDISINGEKLEFENDDIEDKGAAIKRLLKAYNAGDDLSDDAKKVVDAYLSRVDESWKNLDSSMIDENGNITVGNWKGRNINDTSDSLYSFFKTVKGDMGGGGGFGDMGKMVESAMEFLKSLTDGSAFNVVVKNQQ